MVSIILPVYNVEKYIIKCIDSIINQSYEDWELIMVDDGSEDESTNICKKYEKKYDRVKFIRQDNQGMGPARNTGLKHINGDFITFIDSDDWVHTDYLKILVGEQKRTDADIVVCQYTRTFTDLEEINNERKSSMNSDVYEISEKNINNIFNIDFMPWGKLYRKSIFGGNTDIFPAIAFEDYATMPYYFMKSKIVSVVKDCLYVWRNRGGSIVHNISSLPDREKSLRLLTSRVMKDDGLKKYYKSFELFFLKRMCSNDRITADTLFKFQNNFKKEEHSLYEEIFGKKYEEPNLLGYGSFLINTVEKNLSHKGIKDNSNDYYGFSSLIGLMSIKPEGWRLQTMGDASFFRKKAVINEFDSRLLRMTKAEFNQKDYFLIDFMEERYDVGKDSFDNYFTLSDAFSDCSIKIDGGYSVLKREDKKTQKIWEKCCDKFTAWLKDMIKPEQVILVCSKLSRYWGDVGKEYLYSNVDEIDRINNTLEQCYNYFIKKNPGIIVVDGIEDIESYYTHKYFVHGKYPWHLNSYAYKQIANIILDKIYS